MLYFTQENLPIVEGIRNLNFSHSITNDSENNSSFSSPDELEEFVTNLLTESFELSKFKISTDGWTLFLHQKGNTVKNAISSNREIRVLAKDRGVNLVEDWIEGQNYLQIDFTPLKEVEYKLILLQESLFKNPLEARKKKKKAIDLAKKAGIYKEYMDEVTTEEVIERIKNHIQKRKNALQDEKEEITHELYMRKKAKGKSTQNRFKIADRALKSKRKDIESLEQQITI